MRSYQPFPQPPVNPKIFVADIDPGKPPFASFTEGFNRSTQADVDRIFYKTALLPYEDDHADTLYTADDAECFDERKRLAKQLDSIIPVM